MIQTITTLIAATVLLISFNAKAIPPTFTFQTGLGSEDFGEETESFYYLTGGALFSKGLSRNSIVNLIGELSLNERPDDGDNSGEEIFLQGTYSYTPRAGFQVPTYSIGLRHREEYLSDDELDASTTTILLSVSYRLTDRSSILGGLKFSELDARDDTESTGYFLNLDYQYTPQWLLYSTLNIADEDIKSDVAVVASAEGNTAARSFISGHHTPSENQTMPMAPMGATFVSRTSKSDNTFITLGASYRIDTLNSLDFSLNRREYDTSDGSVDGTIYAIDFFHRF